MLVIQNIGVTEDIVESYFACQLSACNGACCVEGDAGAPLELEEAHILEDIYKDVAPFLSAAGKKAIKEQGKYLIDEDGYYETPLIEGKECAYTIFENGIAKCGIEKAWQAGAVDFPKPVSCHLYPIREGRWDSLPAIYYHRWDICNAGCTQGEKQRIPLYQFVKQALIRKFGTEFYQELEAYGSTLHTESSISGTE